jgi:hypothetical protein
VELKFLTRQERANRQFQEKFLQIPHPEILPLTGHAFGHQSLRKTGLAAVVGWNRNSEQI